MLVHYFIAPNPKLDIRHDSLDGWMVMVTLPVNANQDGLWTQAGMWNVDYPLDVRVNGH